MKYLKVYFMSMTVDVRTPSYILSELENEFGALYDPCPINGQYGLLSEWESPSFVNPPYGKEISKWTNKAVIESQNRKTIIMLLPARTDTSWFHDHILRYADEIRFIRGRIRFVGYESGAPFPSMIVVFKGRDRA